MRWPRVVIAAVLALALAGAGWRLVLHGTAVHPTAAPAASQASLLDQLRAFLERRVPPARELGPVPHRPVPRDVLPYGHACPVATRGGLCSLTPCIVLAGGGSEGVVGAGPGGAVLERAIGSRFDSPRGVRVSPPAWPRLPPSCRGRVAAPQTVHVHGL